MMGYGTGAIMAVPAHDERDFEFAREYGLPIRDVVAGPIIAAIYAFFERWDRVNPPREDGPDRLADFVGLCMNQAEDDFDGAFQIVLTRRDADSDQEEPLESGRGAIASIWQDAFPRWPDGFERLAEACRRGELISLLGDADTGEGVGINSSHGDLSIDGMKTRRAKAEVIRWLEQHGAGRRRVHFKLRDWLFSRQRYWGEPFPILHGPDGRIRSVDESELPVPLPEMDDFRPEAGEDPDARPRPPLARADEAWRLVERDGITWERELNTMPQWAGSCWYYLRYLDPKCSDRLAGREVEKYWMAPKGGEKGKRDERPDPGGVDLYVGGVEHAVLHLLYARFWHKILFDLGHVSSPEPFGRLFNQGYIQAYAYTDERGVYVPAEEVEERDGGYYHEGRLVKREFGKMGKSLKNAIAPDDICEQYGCDTLRLYEMYMGPLDQSKIWNTRDIVGVHRFLHRLWRNFVDEQTGDLRVVDEQPPEELSRATHRTIDKVTQSMEAMAFNVAIAAMIELNNQLVNRPHLERAIADPMLRLLGPFAPHICEELWNRIGNHDSIAGQSWPEADPKLLIDEQIELPVQVNGKLRGRITVPADSENDQVEAAARSDAKIAASLEGKTIRKVIIIPGKLVNIVAG
ncbi:MAG: class I tRNA ligase family protein [Phycisphaeraceae bacterium]|nr:class I tRNA ligase family protein [Phycisphaeraceae bacterium]